MTAPTSTEVTAPYVGLAPYGEADAPLFFGREVDTQTIIANLYSARLTILYGPSGVGKSSILQAGVAHRLHEKPDLAVVIFNTWQHNPLHGLRQALTNEITRIRHQLSNRDASTRVNLPTEQESGRLPQKLVNEQEDVSLKALLRDYARLVSGPLMVILDQFEEYFLYHYREEEPQSFTAELARAIMDPNSPASFLISIREDSIAKLDIFERRIPNLFDNYLRLDHMDYQAAEDAILKPLEVYNSARLPNQYIKVEVDLVEDIIERVEIGKVLIGQVGHGQPYPYLVKEQKDKENVRVEPAYLQLVLTRLWDEEVKKGSHVLRRATLASLGNTEQIVRSHLDLVMKKLRPDEQETSARIFNYLVTPSGMKIALTVADLASYAEVGENQVQIIARRLADPDTRVLRTVAANLPTIEETRYEIYHDALAQAILDWRSRYYSQVTLLEKITLPVLFIVFGLMAIDAYSGGLPPLIRSIMRGLALVLINTVALLQVYRWFYRQVSLKVHMLSVSGLGGPNTGILLGILLTGLWFGSTEWPTEANVSDPLGTINTTHFIMYLTTVAITLFFGFITFLLMLGAGNLFRKFLKRFEVGFYGVYFGVCVSILVTLILNWLGIISIDKWISFP